MWEWLSEYQWAGWLIAAAALTGFEVMSLDLVLIMFATGALGGAVVAAVGLPFAISLIAAVIISVAMLGVVRPQIARRLHGGPELTTGHAALVGHTGVSLSQVDETGGQIKLAGETWTARTYDPDLVIEEGTKVVVFKIDGATAVVHPDA